jgi:hypothetical protein
VPPHHYIPRWIMQHKAEVFESDHAVKGLSQTAAKPFKVIVARDRLCQGKQRSVDFGIGLSIDCEHL